MGFGVRALEGPDLLVELIGLDGWTSTAGCQDASTEHNEQIRRLVIGW